MKFTWFDKERDTKAIKNLWANLRALWVLLLATYTIIGVTVLLPKLLIWLENEGFSMILPTVWYEYPMHFIMYLIIVTCPAVLFHSGLGLAFYLIRYRSGIYSEKKEGKLEPKK